MKPFMGTQMGAHETFHGHPWAPMKALCRCLSVGQYCFINRCPWEVIKPFLLAPMGFHETLPECPWEFVHETFHETLIHINPWEAVKRFIGTHAK